VLAFAIASCAGPVGTVPNAHALETALTGKGSALRITIRVPKRKAAHTVRHDSKASYVSPATVSMAIAIGRAGKTVASETVNLVPGTSGCATTADGTVCGLTVPLAPGSYQASISTYDASNAKGNELSADQDAPFTLSAGRVGAVNLTLYGIPHAIRASGAGPGLRASGAGGLTLYGTSPQSLVVNLLDADGNLIVGPGAPTVSASVVVGTDWKISKSTGPASGREGLVVTPPGVNGASARIRVAASYPGHTCAAQGAICAAEIPMVNDVQNLLASVSYLVGSIVTYDPPFTSSSAPKSTLSVPDGFPYEIALDPAGDLFYATGSGAGAFIAPNYTSSVAYQTSGASYSLALDASENLYIANMQGTPPTGSVTVYARQTPLTGGNPYVTITKGLDNPTKVRVDGSGDVFVANSNTVTEYAAPLASANAPAATLSASSSNVQDIALDSAGDLFVAYYNGFIGGGAVAEYVPPFSDISQPVATIVSGVFFPETITFDSEGNLFVANSQGGTVNEFSPPFSSSSAPVAAISNGPNVQPLSMVVDDAENLYVLNCFAQCTTKSKYNSVSVYAPPYAGAPAATITNGLEIPATLLLTP